MLQIRRGVFETNSSSTHSITMCMKSVFDRWESGELYWSRWDRDFIPVKEADEKILAELDGETCPDQVDDLRRNDFGYFTYDEFWDGGHIDYEGYCKHFCTSGGETVVAFGYYGYDY